MKKIFFDNSILTKIAWIKPTQIIGYEKTWDCFLDEIEQVFPKFTKENFEWIHSPFVMLEVIGLGKIRFPIKNLVKKDEWKQYLSNPEDFVRVVSDRIFNYIEVSLPGNKIYRKMLSFIRAFPAHPHTHFMAAVVKKWAKDIKKDRSLYRDFIKSTVWDMTFRYPYIDIRNLPIVERKEAIHLWAKIMGILSREYHFCYSKDLHLEGGALGLSAEIHAIGGFYNDQNTGMYDRILRQWDDMADADSIYYALVGKRKTFICSDPVIVITGDSKKDVLRRLESLYRYYMYMIDRGFPITMIHGTVIFFDTKTMKLVDDPILDVATLINTFNG